VAGGVPRHTAGACTPLHASTRAGALLLPWRPRLPLKLQRMVLEPAWPAVQLCCRPGAWALTGFAAQRCVLPVTHTLQLLTAAAALAACTYAHCRLTDAAGPPLHLSGGHASCSVVLPQQLVVRVCACWFCLPPQRTACNTHRMHHRRMHHLLVSQITTRRSNGHRKSQCEVHRSLYNAPPQQKTKCGVRNSLNATRVCCPECNGTRGVHSPAHPRTAVVKRTRARPSAAHRPASCAALRQEVCRVTAAHSKSRDHHRSSLSSRQPCAGRACGRWRTVGAWWCLPTALGWRAASRCCCCRPATRCGCRSPPPPYMSTSAPGWRGLRQRTALWTRHCWASCSAALSSTRSCVHVRPCWVRRVAHA
jgi:hypothetical protein